MMSSQESNPRYDMLETMVKVEVLVDDMINM
jgi:hypothetical protein